MKEELETAEARLRELQVEHSIVEEDRALMKQELEKLQSQAPQEVALRWLGSSEGLKFLTSEWFKTDAGTSFLSSIAKPCLRSPEGVELLKDKCFSYFRKGMSAGINQSVVRSRANPGVPLEKFEASLSVADWGLTPEEMAGEELSDEDDSDDEEVDVVADP